uniref:Innexin n=1 Tax=Hirondellea gigas TaxID=1518452 RepID=A0A2P2I4A3_9CRUS
MLKYLAVAKILKKHKPSVDNAVLHLHYRFTFLIFVISSAFVTAKEFFGAPIDCLPIKSVPTGILNVYCFIMAIFSVPKHYDKVIGDGVPYHGIGPQLEDDELVYHAYYQWVPLVLFLQAMLFYIPRFIWKQAEGGLFDVILGGLNEPLLGNKEKRLKKHRILCDYMLKNMRMHTAWAWRFFACEMLAFVIVVGNIFFTDYFLGGTFLTYGTDVINFVDMDAEDRIDPMTRLFPTVAKCNFRAFGPSGTVEVYDTMCILAVNIITQKIYILIWFWLIALAAITGGWLIIRAATIVSKDVRGRMLQYRGRVAGPEQVALIQKHCDLGDWFLLYQLGRAIEPTIYAEFLKELAKELENTPPRDETNPMLSN